MTIKIKSSVNITATIALSEPDLRALDAMVGYGIEPFLKVFYRDLGTAYMKPYEANLRTLFKTIGENVPQALSEIDKTRKALLSPDGYKVTKNT